MPHKPLTPQQYEALKTAQCGPLHWNPPVEIDDRFAGERRGDITGFYLTDFGYGRPKGVRALRKPISMSRAIEVADILDGLGYFQHEGRSSSDGPVGHWVRQIVDLLPGVMDAAIANAEARVDELVDIKRKARRA